MYNPVCQQFTDQYWIMERWQTHTVITHKYNSHMTALRYSISSGKNSFFFFILSLEIVSFYNRNPAYDVEVKISFNEPILQNYNRVFDMGT